MKSLFKLTLASLMAGILMQDASAATTLIFTNTAVSSSPAFNRNWSVASNWNPNQVPANGDTLQFNASGVVTTNDLTGLSLDQVIFGRGNWFVWGNDVSVGTAGVDFIASAGAAASRMNVNVSIGGNTTITNSYTAQDLRFGENLGASTPGGAITGSGGVTIYGPGRVGFYNGGNSYEGDTVISANGSLILSGDASEKIPNGGGKGNVIVNAGGLLDIGGKTETINGLSGGGVVTNTGGGCTFAVGDNGVSSTFSGFINNGANSLNFVKTGGGTLTLSGANGYTGTTTISDGTLKLGASGVIPDGTGAGNVTINFSTLDLNGFNETVNGLTGNGTVDNVAGGGSSLLTIGNNNQGTTFSGLIQNSSGSVGITKIGSGTVTLSGSLTYSGNTTVNAGTLKLNSASAALTGGITVADGATLLVDDSGGTTLNIGTATFNATNGNTLTLNYGAILSLGMNATNLILNGPVTLNLTTTTHAFTVGESNVLVQYTSKTGAGSIALGTLPNGVLGHLVLDSVNKVYALVVDAVVNSLTWTGSGSAVWDTNTVNWLDTATLSVPSLYTNQYGATPLGDIVTFNDTTAGYGNQYNVNLSMALQPALATVNSGSTYTFSGSGKLTGSAKLTKEGTGTLLIQTANDFSGGTTLSGGVLQLGSATALGSGSLFIAGATLSSDSAAARTITNAFKTTGNNSVFGDGVNAGKLTFNSPMDLNFNNRSITFNADVQLAAGTQNGGSLSNKKGVGTLTLKGQNNWSAGTALFLIQQGTTILDSGSLITPNEIRMDANIADGYNRLVLTNGAAITNISSAGLITVGYNTGLYTSTTNLVDLAGIVRFPNGVGGNGGVISLGRGANGTQGTAAIANFLTGGDLEFSKIGRANSFQGNPGYVELNFDGGVVHAMADQADYMSGFDVANIRSGGFNLDTRSYSLTIAQNMAGVGALTKTGNGTLFLNGTNSYAGMTTISAGTLGGSGSVAGSVSVAGTFSPGGGNSIKTFTIGGTLWATNLSVFSLNKTVSPSNSLAVVAGTINVGGTLTVTNIGTGGAAALAAGDSFKLFNKEVTGSFATVLPTPPANTAWTNKLTQDGSIALYALPTTPTATNISYTFSGGEMVLTWPNGVGWNLQVQTNTLAIGLGTNWTTVSGATSPFTNTVGTANGAVFYRLTYP